MDTAIIGVIVGSLLSLAGTFLQSWFASRNEEKKFKREVELERTKRLDEYKRIEVERLRELYENSVRSLSEFLAACDIMGDGVPDGNKTALTSDSLKWLSAIAIRRPSREFELLMRQFAESPRFAVASQLRNAVIELARSDEALPVVSEPSQKTAAADGGEPFRVSVYFSKEFRNQKFVEGVTVPFSRNYEIRMSEMSSMQRERLIEALQEDGQSRILPPKFTLNCPHYHPKAKEIRFDKRWDAQLDPNEASPHDILSFWLADFEKCMQQAEADRDEDAAKPGET